jgi:hypothetical protein
MVGFQDHFDFQAVFVIQDSAARMCGGDIVPQCRLNCSGERGEETPNPSAGHHAGLGQPLSASVRRRVYAGGMTGDPIDDAVHTVHAAADRNRTYCQPYVITVARSDVEAPQRTEPTQSRSSRASKNPAQAP